jgi:molybdopterin synthase catalytic subunit
MSITLPNDPYEATTKAGDHVALTYKPLDEMHEINLARDSAAGAICSFIGTTRDNFQGVHNTVYDFMQC